MLFFLPFTRVRGTSNALAPGSVWFQYVSMSCEKCNLYSTSTHSTLQSTRVQYKVFIHIRNDCETTHLQYLVRSTCISNWYQYHDRGSITKTQGECAPDWKSCPRLRIHPDQESGGSRASSPRIVGYKVQGTSVSCDTCTGTNMAQDYVRYWYQESRSIHRYKYHVLEWIGTRTTTQGTRLQLTQKDPASKYC